MGVQWSEYLETDPRIEQGYSFECGYALYDYPPKAKDEAWLRVSTGTDDIQCSTPNYKNLVYWWFVYIFLGKMWHTLIY